jgi:hypothetical protein
LGKMLLQEPEKINYHSTVMPKPNMQRVHITRKREK